MDLIRAIKVPPDVALFIDFKGRYVEIQSMFFALFLYI
jgi:hypothetical protein